ncbi:MAG: hypothetical protein WBL61_14660 [Bryobacteraceae bacterium]
MTVTELRQPNAQLFCKLLHDALEREEKEIHNIGVRFPADRYLLSVACAPEVVVGYLVRKQALRRDVAIVGERRYEAGAAGLVDFCAVDVDGKCTASLEIKGPIGDWAGNGRLLEDIEKHFDPSVRIEGATPSAKRYNAWILIEQAAATSDELNRRVEKLLSGPGGLDEIDVSAPISINRVNNVVYQDDNGHSYGNLRVIVFSAR